MRKKLNKANVKNLQAEATRYEVADTETPPFRVRVTPSGVKTFILRYRNAEHRTRVFTIGKFGDLTPEQARDIAQTKLAEVKLGRDPAAVKQEIRRERERKKHMTLRGFLELKYGPWVKANRKTGAALVARIESCFLDEFGETLIDEITAWSIERWRKERLKQGRAVGTVNRDLSALKAALSRAVDWDLIEQHPLGKVKPGREDKLGVVRFLSEEEEARLRAALEARNAELREGRERGNAWRRERGRDTMPAIGAYGDHLTPLVVLSLNTGVRRGEAFNLQWADVHLDRASIAIRGEGAKTGKTRHVPLNDEALSALRVWSDQGPGTGYVFPSRDGGRLDNVKKAWAGLMEKSQIKGFRWHDMRHHFASKLVMAGVDLNTVRELLGHSDIKMTLRYAHLAPEHKAAAVAKLTAGRV